MDFYEATFFGKEKGEDEVICKMDEVTRDSYWPFKIRFRHESDRPFITLHFATFMEIYLFVQSVNESYEQLLAAKEG